MSSSESTEQKIDEVLKNFLLGDVDHEVSPNQLHKVAKQALLSLIAENRIDELQMLKGLQGYRLMGGVPVMQSQIDGSGDLLIDYRIVEQRIQTLSTKQGE